MRRSGIAVVPLLVLACGPSTTQVPTPKGPAAGPSAAPAPPVVSPARWTLLPTRLTNLRARVDLPKGTLFGGDGGERWLDKRDGSPPDPATSLLPEGIAAIARTPDDKTLLFVGASGTVYAASDPLGPIGSTKAPPSPLRSATAGRNAVVGIAGSSLVRTADGGASWTKIDLPGFAGTLVQVALNDGGIGVALAAPQRAWATIDDGATWTPVATPGVGAKRVVLDANGDVMIEGVEASALLKTAPTRLERVARAPKSDGFDIASTGNTVVPGYAKAVHAGRGAFIVDRYLEAIPEPDDPTRWRIAYGKLGERPEIKKLAELNGCDHVYVGGDAQSLWLACDDRGNKKPSPSTFGTGPKPPKYGPSQLKLLRSDDGAKTWHDDGALGAKHTESGRVWVTPDRSLVIDGGCKKTKTECWDGPPVVRPFGSKTFAKVNLPARVSYVPVMAFAPSGGRAYALGRAPSGPLVLLVSKNGGKDFTRAALPAVPAADPNQPALAPQRAEPTGVSVDPSGVVVATARVSNDWIVYVSEDEGATVKGLRFPHRADGLSMVGKRGFAWHHDGKGWETNDAGATWVAVEAPAFADGTAADRQIACGAYGCFVGDRATRIGWGGTGKTQGGPDPSSTQKSTPASSLTCTVEGEWKSLGPLLALPGAYDADVAPGVRFLGIRHDTTKGSVAVVLGKVGAKGLETKDVQLFGPAPKDTATAVLPQIEGAAAIRFAFKREAPKTDAKDKDKDKDKKKPPSTTSAIVDGQKVDVEVAWYVAATGAVHKATIKGAGPLDPRDVIGGAKDGAAGVNVALLSIAQGGVHVRPFASKPEVPLWFVREGGKVDRLPWPDLPAKDVSGAQLALRIDAVRAAGRSVVLGVAGTQLVMAWANESGTAWDTRTWGLFPELKGGDASWDFTYLAGTAGPRPAIVAQWSGGAGLPSHAWGVPLKGAEPDPSETVALPTQKLLADPPAACAATDAAPRVVAPPASGTRHPIVVVGEGNDIVLATGAAVLRGDGKGACVAAYEARPVSVSGKKPDDAYAALVSWGDKEHGLLFKTAAANGDASVRVMKCGPGKEVPGLDVLDEK